MFSYYFSYEILNLFVLSGAYSNHEEEKDRRGTGGARY